jgi:hypothetical protein
VSRVLVCCLEPERRDALEETARLALNFVTVTTGPGYSDFKASRDIKVHLSAVALRRGCHLPDMAQELLEAVQAHGIEILRAAQPEGEITPEWAQWWEELPQVDEEEFELVLEIR